MRTSLAAALVALVLLTPLPSAAYSVQTHEHLIDLAWKPSIEPLLRKRFPAITDAQLQEAHAYAYGGCAIQGLGYYPFVNAFFSDLTHFVRSARNRKTRNNQLDWPVLAFDSSRFP